MSEERSEGCGTEQPETGGSCSGSSLRSMAARVWRPCASWWNSRSRRGKLGLVVGGASTVVAIGLAVFLYLFLRPVFVVTVETDDAAVSGDDVVLSICVSNEGRTAGEYELRALVDGEEVETELVKLNVGAREQVSISLTGLAAGHYDVSLAGWPELAQNVWVMTPPEFEITAIQVQPNPVDISTDDEIEVAVGVANVGEAPGLHELQVALNGDVVDSREVEVNGGDHVDESFTVTVAEPGLCEVMVGDRCVDVEVYQLVRPRNGKVLAKRGPDSDCRLEIKNSDDMDCVLVLEQEVQEEGDDQHLFAAYVHAQSRCTVRGIPSGTYKCYYSFGEDWCTYRNKFIRDDRYGEFDESLTFREFRLGMLDGSYKVNSTVITLELGGTSGGSLPSSVVSPSEFPDL